MVSQAARRGRKEPAARERLGAANGDYIDRSGLREVEANVVYAIATKAGEGRRAVTKGW
jgi:hypothetical protein